MKQILWLLLLLPLAAWGQGGAPAAYNSNILGRQVYGTVLLQSSDGVNSLGINAANPLPMTCISGCTGGGGSSVVTQPTASLLNATVVGTGTFATQSAITAAAGSQVDIGTGGSPAANTVNANLKNINTTLGSPLQAGGVVSVSNLPASQPVTNAGTFATQSSQGVAGALSNGWPAKITDGTNVLGTAANPLFVEGAFGGSFLLITSQTAGSVGAGTAGSVSDLVGGVYNSTLPTLTTGQQAGIQLDSNGRQLVVTTPAANANTTTNSSSTVTTGGTFQQISASNTSRKSLEFQNICNASGQPCGATHTADNCYLFFGTTGAATKNTSITLAPGASYGRYVGSVPSDALQFTCDTTADPFVANVQ